MAITQQPLAYKAMRDLKIQHSGVSHLDELLTPEFLDLVSSIDLEFAPRRNELLMRRREIQKEIGDGATLDFLSDTQEIRTSTWEVAPIPTDLQTRLVEITGPATPKMAINAMNSGANVWLADLEDSSTPHWRNVLESQWVIGRVIRRDLEFAAENGKLYELNEGQLPTLKVRPRGLHLPEPRCRRDEAPTVGAFFDAALHVVNNAKYLLESGSGPYFYLPKLESHLETRLWNDVFAFLETHLGLPENSIKVTVLIETIPAAFQMDEILFELKGRIVGLNAGRWDYLFSIIKYFRDAGLNYVLPDRNQITMSAPMMRAYTDLLVATCHKRKAMAIGGMSAFIPSRNDPGINEVALEKVRADKQREAHDGFDGSWVAHPDLVPICRQEFLQVLGDSNNQVSRVNQKLNIQASDLLAIQRTEGTCTELGLHTNIEIFLRYVHSWLRGTGAVAIHNLMEDAATAEISRSQVWQQIRNSVVFTDSGATANVELATRILKEESSKLIASGLDPQFIEEAVIIFEAVSLRPEFPEFLTIPASEFISD
jgi:malate synthase